MGRPVVGLAVAGLLGGAAWAGGGPVSPRADAAAHTDIIVAVASFSPGGVFVCADGSAVAADGSAVVAEREGRALWLTRRGQVDRLNRVSASVYRRAALGGIHMTWQVTGKQTMTLLRGGAAGLPCRLPRQSDLPSAVPEERYRCADGHILQGVRLLDARVVLDGGSLPGGVSSTVLSDVMPRLASGLYASRHWRWTTHTDKATLLKDGRVRAKNCIRQAQRP